MNIGVLGTGIVGQTIAARLAGLGHGMMIGTRDPDVTLARTDPDIYGNPPFPVWREQHLEIGLGTFAEAAVHGELVVNTTAGTASLDALGAAGKENFEGKALLDIANPLDFSQGMPPVAARFEHRLARRADPARLSRRQGGQGAEHHERARDGTRAS